MDLLGGAGLGRCEPSCGLFSEWVQTHFNDQWLFQCLTPASNRLGGEVNNHLTCSEQCCLFFETVHFPNS